MIPTLRASVVVPTHDRREKVVRTLAALGEQSMDPSEYEVIVVPNGCTDGTSDAIRLMSPAHALRVINLPAPGVSAARNAGAEAARAPLLIFLDDDIEPQRKFVEAHVRAHAGSGGDSGPRVSIGYLPSVLQPEADQFAIALRGWWEAMFDRLRNPGRRRGYSDLLSGNMSVPRQVFLDAGGFDTSLRCHEDYELGYRLLRAGCRFVFAEEAVGIHRDHTRLDGACRRKRDEGTADVALARRYPELRTVLPMAHPRTLKWRMTTWLAFDAPRLGDALVSLLARTALPLLERTRAVMTWYRLLYGIFGYWYSRGLADALGSRAALRLLLRGAWADERLRDPGLRVDLGLGLDAVRAIVREARPHALTFAVGTRVVGHLPYTPGTEPLDVQHVQAALATSLHRAAFEALRQAGLADARRDGWAAGNGSGAPKHDLAEVTSGRRP